MRRLNDLTLNVVLALVTIAAITMVSIRVYERFWGRPGEPQPRRVANWRDFAAGGRRIGPPAAAVTIIEFSDFQCPFCRQAAEDLSEIRRQYPDRVAVVFRYFPLPMHQFAAAAARAAECAGRQHAFEAYHNLLFSSQDLIGRRSWTEYARDAGISDAHAFQACMTDPAVFALVEHDREAGKKLGVTGTPSLLINDLELPGYPGADKLKARVRSAVDASRRSPGTPGETRAATHMGDRPLLDP